MPAAPLRSLALKPFEKIAILGVGLIGGSIGLGARRRGLAEQLVGIGRNSRRLQAAQERGCVDRHTTDIAAGVTDAGLVIVCTPVERIVEHVRQVARHVPSGCLITDAGSTKESICAALDGPLHADRDVRFIGSHPLAGSEKTGAEHADADLFVGRVVVVTPTDGAAPSDVERIAEFWRAIGASVLPMPPPVHDAALAMTSHAPHLIASALAAATDDEQLPLAASGWQDTTRIAAADPALWRQIFADNRGHVLKTLDKFEKVLSQLRQALENKDDERLERLLEEGKRRRDSVGS